MGIKPLPYKKDRNASHNHTGVEGGSRRLFQSFIRRLRRWASSSDKVSGTPSTPLSEQLDKNLGEIRRVLGDSPDVTIRRLSIGTIKSERAAIVFIDGLVDKTVVNNHILRPLMNRGEGPVKSRASMVEILQEQELAVGGIRETRALEDLIDAVLAGDVALLVHGTENAIIVNARGWEKRAIQEPITEVIIKGPRDGFVETIRTNTALLRRRIGHPSLRLETLIIGKKTRTEVTIAYLKGLADDATVEEVRRRLRRIDTDGILAAGFIEQFIEDSPFSPFTTTSYTERPDVCSARLLEGRVAVFIDGTPVVVTVPALFIESFQSPDDYNFRPFYSTLIRYFRYSAYGISILLSPVYVAFSTYHQELIPTPLLITMAAANEGTPFPAMAEVIGMGIVFEILREAGIRLPRPIGQAVSIVGALVIGEATVSAGLVGAPVVIVVALTAIASFVVPAQAESATLLRFFLTLLAGILGAFGIMGGLITVFVHLASLRSFGVPYLTPFSPLMPHDLKDAAFRAPLWAMHARPRMLTDKKSVRQEESLRPQPPKKAKNPDRNH